MAGWYRVYTMTLPSYIRLPFEFPTDLPEQFQTDDVRYTEELVEYFVHKFTQPGDLVFDPFTGFGTTLNVARKLGREVYGTEIHENRVQYLEETFGLQGKIRHGDIMRIPINAIPEFKLLLTSPPYMGKEDPANALTGYKYAGEYEQYLKQIQSIFQTLGTRLHPEGRIVVEISNLKQQHSRTTLAWDVGKKLADVLEFEGEVIIAWEGADKPDGIYNYGYDHSYCLIYSKPLNT